ncbi:MAG: hypothetical protein ACO3S5_06415 [Ilumatobacteraceae bacterium]
MSRLVEALNAAEADKAAVTLVVMVEILYDSGPIRVHDGIGDLSLTEYLLMEDGDNLLAEDNDLLTTESDILPFLGIGELGTIDSVEENIEVIARQVTMTLSGMDSALLTPALGEPYQNRPVTIYLGFINPDTGRLIATPEVIWEGRINQQTITLLKGEATLTMTCEHRLRREPRIARYTNADQEVAFPGDRFFDLLPTIEGFVGKWGQRDVGFGGGRPGPGPGPGGDRDRLDRN